MANIIFNPSISWSPNSEVLRQIASGYTALGNAGSNIANNLTSFGKDLVQNADTEYNLRQQLLKNQIATDANIWKNDPQNRAFLEEQRKLASTGLDGLNQAYANLSSRDGMTPELLAELSPYLEPTYKLGETHRKDVSEINEKDANARNLNAQAATEDALRQGRVLYQNITNQKQQFDLDKDKLKLPFDKFNWEITQKQQERQEAKDSYAFAKEQLQRQLISPNTPGLKGETVLTQYAYDQKEGMKLFSQQYADEIKKHNLSEADIREIIEGALNSTVFPENKVAYTTSKTQNENIQTNIKENIDQLPIGMPVSSLLGDEGNLEKNLLVSLGVPDSKKDAVTLKLKSAVNKVMAQLKQDKQFANADSEFLRKLALQGVANAFQAKGNKFLEEWRSKLSSNESISDDIDSNITDAVTLTKELYSKTKNSYPYVRKLFGAGGLFDKKALDSLSDQAMRAVQLRQFSSYDDAYSRLGIDYFYKKMNQLGIKQTDPAFPEFLKMWSQALTGKQLDLNLSFLLPSASNSGQTGKTPSPKALSNWTSEQLLQGYSSNTDPETKKAIQNELLDRQGDDVESVQKALAIVENSTDYSVGDYEWATKILDKAIKNNVSSLNLSKPPRQLYTQTAFQARQTIQNQLDQSKHELAALQKEKNKTPETHRRITQLKTFINTLESVSASSR